MKKKTIHITLFSIAVGLVCLVTLPIVSQTQTQTPPVISNSQEPPKTARFAFLVGINEYDDEAVSDLNGCENDVILMRETLRDLYNFRPETEIKELISSRTSKTEKPTKANIEKFFREHLIKSAREFKEKNNLSADNGATIVFYYSGHGSYVPDQNTVNEGKDEGDGQDETIVPMDSTKIDGSGDIRDDDINKWFAELRRYTTNITFIFDSCHSGTTTRGTGNRSLERDTKKANTRRGGGTALNETMDESGDYVTISGSLPNEKSQEASLPAPLKPDEKIPDGEQFKEQYYGFLTYFLVQQLRQNQGISYRELMQMVSTAVTKKNPDQTPQVEGDIDRAFLGSKESRGRRAIPIQKIEKTGNATILTIEAGRIVGALPGGAVGIYSENAAQLAGEQDRIAVGVITDSLNFTSKVKVEGKEIPARAKVILANPFFTLEKRAVAIDTSGMDVSAQVMKKLKALLENNSYVKSKEENDLAEKLENRANPASAPVKKDWNIAVVRSTFAKFKEGKPKSAVKDRQSPKDDEAGFYLASPNGNPLYNFWIKASAAQAEEEIKTALELHTRVENLQALDNAAGRLSGGLKIEIVRLKSFKLLDPEQGGCAFEEYSEAERKKMKDENTPLNPGEYFYLEITNATKNNLFFYLYNIKVDGETELIYEPEADGDILLSGNKLPTFMGANCSGSIMRTNELGKETFKLVAVSKRFDGNLLTNPKIANDFRSKETARRDGDPALESFFAQTATNQTRSEKIEIPFSGWGTAKLEIEIVEK